jgi:hypothetical protein
MPTVRRRPSAAGLTAVTLSAGLGTYALHQHTELAYVWDAATRRPIGAPLAGHTGWTDGIAAMPATKARACR